MNKVDVQGTRQGQAPGLACACLLLVPLGILVGFWFPPVWLITAGLLLWVALE